MKKAQPKRGSSRRKPRTDAKLTNNLERLVKIFSGLATDFKSGKNPRLGLIDDWAELKKLDGSLSLEEYLNLTPRESWERGNQVPPEYPPTKRGRPQSIPDERKVQAIKALIDGASYRQAAIILHDTPRPTRTQVNGVQAILENFLNAKLRVIFRYLKKRSEFLGTSAK